MAKDSQDFQFQGSARSKQGCHGSEQRQNEEHRKRTTGRRTTLIISNRSEFPIGTVSAETAPPQTFWVSMKRVWARLDQALMIVKPETVLTWHREGFRLFWTEPHKTERDR